ncbi:MAG TPA: Asp23/Gls24 family envelope stress response protein [Thermoflexales bacterium]|jgi:uncharacterized alkaline shock family protein YloU|nr:Asp23/Gls24 family envelope stress response protein [Thermoflexales bacterium]HQX09670.1 Asp23/Gls24 family envelope stress response protein [Thermoflexales bacterium]HQY23539.1 Asp23/Gls24 family envelope stress response protein [Thermoflexales bacterium]HQZ54059.1 Asp23/Gls24 family envelope stress response protein [Thermoflexales bacterium]HRA53187.1 Asp23/Gls24 family envelope stress response protein [Thermoflexales bacterium]
MSANNSTPTDSSTSGAGAITIRPQVVFTLALTAALATYGVVGIASRYTGLDVTHRDPRRGLDVKLTQGPAVMHVTVDAHVIVEYGVRIGAVVESVQHQVAYRIERSTGFCVDVVNVHVVKLHAA